MYNGPWSNESSLESLTTLDFSTEYGIDNWPNYFISQFPTGYGGFAPTQIMLGPIQPPLTSVLGGDGFITIDFATVNTLPLCENLRFSSVSEQAVMDLWTATCESYGYAALIFPGTGSQIGNYAITSTGNNAAPSSGFFGWRITNYPNPTPVTVATFDIDENNYDVDGIAWQVNV